MDDFADSGKLLPAWQANAGRLHQDHVVVVLPSFSMAPTILAHYRDRIPPLEHRFLVAMLMLRTIPGADMVMITCADPGAVRSTTTRGSPAPRILSGSRSGYTCWSFLTRAPAV